MKSMYVVAGMLMASGVCAEDFPQFRGPGGSAHVQAQDIPLEWTDKSNIAWQTAIPGTGWSQPVISGDQIFVTAAVSEKLSKPKNFSDGTRMPQSMGLGGFTRPPRTEIAWRVFCLQTSDGAVVWEKTVHTGPPKFAVHPSNTYATESPVVDGDHVYAYFGAAGRVTALDRSDGRQVWQQDIGVFRTSNNFGTGSSLAIHAGHVFAQNFTEASADVYCFAGSTGEIKWKQSRKKTASSWSSPLTWKTAARTELIVSGGQRVDSFDPITGKTLWTLTNVKAATACSPCADSERLYFGGSDPFSKGPLFAVQAGASGDLSPDKKNDNFTNCAWLVKRAAPGMASPVSSGEFLYVAADNILRCYDAATGDLHYQKRLPNIGRVAASPLIVGDKLLVLDESGAACLLAVGKQFEVVGKGKISDTFWSSPAVANGSIYLRGVDKLYCIR